MRHVATATLMLIAAATIGGCAKNPDQIPSNTHAGEVAKQIERDPQWQSDPRKAELHQLATQVAGTQAQNGQLGATSREAEVKLNAAVTAYCADHLTEAFCTVHKSEK